MAKSPKKKKSNPRIVTKKRVSKKETRLQIENRRQKQQIAKLQSDIAEAKKWVPAAEPEWTRESGVLAAQPSRLRHTTVGKNVRKEMVKLERKSRSKLTDYIRFWAAELDIPVQEFWTLLMSP